MLDPEKDPKAAESAAQTVEPAEPVAAVAVSQPAPQSNPKPAPKDPYLRAPNEDDDGYDPYSDRRYEPPMFERDPWY